MEAPQKAGLKLLYEIGYLPNFTRLVQSHCAPFVWSARINGDLDEILHNGTVTFIDTGARLIAVTANHVYQQYLADQKEHDSKNFGCQFGGSSFEPERHLIDSSDEADLATFDFPRVLLAHAGIVAHGAIRWPSPPAIERQVVIVGGFPGNLRQLNTAKLEQPFQHFICAIKSVSNRQITLHLDYENMFWPGHEGETINKIIGGMSGGPVFRVIEQDPIDRLELVGFVKEGWQEMELLFATHVSAISASGEITVSS